MSTGWKVWLGLLGVVSLYGLVLVGQAQDAADLNEILASGAPQQTVVGLWHLRDLITVVVFESIVLIVAVVSVGIALGTQGKALDESATLMKPVE
jgi:hypothetical protein